MMNDTFDGSFKIYVEPESNHPGMAGNDPGRNHEMFSMEVDNVKEDMMNLEKYYNRLQESNEEIKNVQSAKAVNELRAKLITDLQSIFKLAKHINRKYDGLVRANAALRKVKGSGPGSSDDQVRANMISQLVESLQFMMRKFQGLRTQMECEHRQHIEARYFAITHEKATAEAIDNLIATEVPESPLYHAMQEFGRGPVLEAVAEIQERRDTMREVRRNLMALHQVFLGIASPVTAAAPAEGQGGGNRGGPPSPVDALSPSPLPLAHLGAGKAGTGGLNDYERETRNQAYFAIAIALVIIIALIFGLLKGEYDFENKPDV